MSRPPDPRADDRRIELAEYQREPGHGRVERDDAQIAGDRYERALVRRWP